MVYGDYFWVYDLNFDSHERIAGIPSVPVSGLHELWQLGSARRPFVGRSWEAWTKCSAWRAHGAPAECSSPTATYGSSFRNAPRQTPLALIAALRKISSSQ